MITNGNPGAEAGSGRNPKPISLMMLMMSWTKKFDDGTPANDKDMISVLADAPDIALQTVLVATFIESFFREQKVHLIMRGFIPYLCFWVATMGYLTSTRARLKQQDELINSQEEFIKPQDEIEYKPLDIGFISVMILGTIYFSVLEVIQSMTLKS